jgi:hypothetical protein
MTYLYVFYFLSVWACPIGHVAQAVQRPAHCPIVPARLVWYREQTGAACPAFGRVCRCVAWSALHLARPALLPVLFSLSGCAGLGSPPLGYMGRAVGGVVDTSRRKNSKKAFSPYPPPLFCTKRPTPVANLKNSAQKQKDPYKGAVFCAILALQALKGRNLQWLKVK